MTLFHVRSGVSVAVLEEAPSWFIVQPPTGGVALVNKNQVLTVSTPVLGKVTTLQANFGGDVYITDGTP